MMAFTHC
jgi:hypothetical protein